MLITSCLVLLLYTFFLKVKVVCFLGYHYILLTFLLFSFLIFS